MLLFINGLYTIEFILLILKVLCSSTQSTKPTCRSIASDDIIPPYVKDCVRLNYEPSRLQVGTADLSEKRPKRDLTWFEDLSALEEAGGSHGYGRLLWGTADEPSSIFAPSGPRGRGRWDGGRFTKLKLAAFDRDFELLLTAQSREMAPDILILSVTAHQNESSLDVRTHLRTLYKGIVKGDAYSHVEGSIVGGVFEGKITLGASFTPRPGSRQRQSESYAVYYVERVHGGRGRGSGDGSEPFHSIIYSDQDLDDDYSADGRTAKGEKATTTTTATTTMAVAPSAEPDMAPHTPDKGGDVHVHDSWCGLSDEKNLRWMMSHYQESPSHPSLHRSKQKGSNSVVPNDDDIDLHHANQPIPSVCREELPKSLDSGNHDYVRKPYRTKRSVPDKNTCSIFIQTDPFLWNHISKKLGSKDKSRIREEIIAMISSHINAVNHIYGSSKFGDVVGIQFVVQRIKILEDTYCDNIVSQKQESYCNPNLDVSNVLNLWSLENHDDFCLAYLWTYRDFIGGTLGLAWVAASEREAGGLCETFKPYSEFVQNKRLTTYKSLNTGIITLVNYGSPVSPRVTHLTFAHEIGHNLGSPHDYPTNCRPGQAFSDPKGNYIMFSSATSGDRLNNDKFSPCSKNNVSQILEAVIYEKYGKVNCLIKSDGAFCGNGLKEAGEECDCGYAEECQANGEIMCCYPRTEDLTKSCKKKPNVMCSPSEGQCCTKQCKHVTPDTICARETECSYQSQCSGLSAQCPSPRFKANRTTACNDNTQVCWSGQCGGSICQKVNLEQCFITAPRGDKNYDRGKLCELACQMPNQPKTCKSSYEYPALRNINKGKGINLKPGSPCNNFQGYCDVLLKCREVDSEGPLTRLKNLIFNTKTFSILKFWIQGHWWAISLIAFSMMFFMGIFIKCCAVHTPSNNPKKPPARSFSDTMSRTANTIRRTGHQMVHTAYTLRRNASGAQYHHSSSSIGVDQRNQAQPQQLVSRKPRAYSRPTQQYPQAYSNGGNSVILPPIASAKNGVTKGKTKKTAKNGLGPSAKRISASSVENGANHHYKKSANSRKNGRHKIPASENNNYRSSSQPPPTNSHHHNNVLASNHGTNMPAQAVLHHPGPHYVGHQAIPLSNNIHHNRGNVVVRERDLFTKRTNDPKVPSSNEKDNKKRKKKVDKDKKGRPPNKNRRENGAAAAVNNSQLLGNNYAPGAVPPIECPIGSDGRGMMNPALDLRSTPPTSDSMPPPLPQGAAVSINMNLAQQPSQLMPPNLTISSYDQPPPPYTPSAPPGETSLTFVKSSSKLPRGGYGKNRGVYNQSKKDSSSNSSSKKKNSKGSN